MLNRVMAPRAARIRIGSVILIGSSWVVSPAIASSFYSFAGKSLAPKIPRPVAKNPTLKKSPKVPVVATPEPLAPSPSSFSPSLRASVQWINAGSWTELRASSVNPKNSVFEIPSLQGYSDVRPDFKVEQGSLHLIFRPRLRYNPTRTEVNGRWIRATGIQQVDLHVNEANLQLDLSDSVALTYGLQNYQWGPAEFLSPSNRIYHETAQVKDVLYETRGKHMARLNFTPEKEWSIVAMGELTSNGESEFVADVPFEAKALGKIEYNWSSGADYLGIVGGTRSKSGPWVGEYANLTFFDSLYLYVDASHQRGSQAWYPVQQSSGIYTLARSKSNEDRISHYAVMGARYAFEGGSDLRLEYAYYDAGYDSSERKMFKASINSQSVLQLVTNAQNASKLKALGVELPGRNFAYASLRIPDLLGVKDLSLYNRYIFSLEDQSGMAYSSADYALGQSGTLLLAGGWSHGTDLSELAGLTRYTLLAGYRHTW